tara:strand:+ start:66 stop:1067 length:1002 start_codon:yes stop_codon:yes gene_type:complete
MIFTKNKVFIVAEIGNNHEGKLSNAFKLIDKAKEAGVDAVKFQTYEVKKYYSSNTDKKRIKRLKQFQLSYNSIIKLSNYAKKLGLVFFSTPFDERSAVFLNQIQNIFKISSGDNDFYNLIEKVLSFKKPIIISTGMMDFKEVKKLYQFIKKKNFKSQICFLHCVSSYPVPITELNLNAIRFLKEKFPKCIIGYSDHSDSIESCILSAHLGAYIIEKHFTLDKDFSDFRDHKLSADPVEMKRLVDTIRNLDRILGKKQKKIQKSEKSGLIASRRSIAPNKKLEKNTIVKSSDIIYVRPRTQLSIFDEKKIIGKKLNKTMRYGEHFMLKNLINSK